MVPIAAVQQAKAKLMLKGKHRPDKMVRKKMPDGTELLASVPERSGPDEDVDAERNFCAAIDKVSDVFWRQKRAASTADEHRGYMRLIDGWLVRRGHGSYVECITNESGRLVEVRTRRAATGERKVIMPQMLKDKIR